MEHRVQLTFVFKEHQDEYDEGYTYLELEGLEPDSNLPVDKDMMYGFLEMLCQSDFYSIGLPEGIVEALDGKTVHFSEDRYR